ARAAGAEVHERRNAEVRTKGASLNEALAGLRHECWDALVILDVDARGHEHFLTRVSAYLRRGAAAIQAVPVSKNAAASVVSRLAHLGQRLSQLIQTGRSALGLSAILWR